MDKNVPAELKTWQTVTAALAAGLILSLAGWGWWNGKGPFREIKATPPAREKIDLLEGVKYVTTRVVFDGFTDSAHTLRWNDENKSIFLRPHWQGEDPLSFAPVLKDLQSIRTEILPIREINKRGTEAIKEWVRVDREVDQMEQDINKEIAKVVLAGGFRPLPYATPGQTNVSAISCAHITTHIRTHVTTSQNGEVVFFKVNSTIGRSLHAQFKKPTLVGVTVMTHQSYEYVVPKKEALKAIKEVARETTALALKISREHAALRDDEERELPPNPEGAPVRRARFMSRPEGGR